MTKREDPGSVLQAALDAVGMIDVSERALDELLHTASESGLIDGCSIEDAYTIMQIAELAKTFPNGRCPSEYRM